MTIALVTISKSPNNLSPGYTVRIYDRDKVVACYVAGGHPLDSCAPGESPFPTVRRWALTTAKEMFAEHTGREPSQEEIDIEIEKTT